jgi:hypothetical protein
MAVTGCATSKGPPPHAPIPQEPTLQATRQPAKPLPAPRPEETMPPTPPPAFDDVPLVTQEAPETPAFLTAYKAVNQPRIAIFVNRTLEGSVVPVNDNAALATIEHTRKSSGPVTVDRNESENRRDPWEKSNTSSNDRFQSSGPAEYKEATSVYLRPGQYDEAAAKAIDYEAIESVLNDFVRSDGRVQTVSPLLARQKLSDEQVKALESGRPQVLREVAQQLDADILIHVTAHPTKQTAQGLQIRVLCEAINIKGGESIASAVVDVPPPLEKTTINRYTRYLGRRLIDGMTKTWTYGPPPGTRQPPAGMQSPVIPPPPSNAPQTTMPSPVPPPAPEPAPVEPPSTMPAH